MSKLPRDTRSLIEDGPSETAPVEPGYGAWLRAQLEQAVADLDAPEDAAIEHEQVFAELDRVIARVLHGRRQWPDAFIR